MAKSRKETTVEVRLKITPEARTALVSMSPSARKQGEFLTALLLASYARYRALQEEASADPVDAVLAGAGLGKGRGVKKQAGGVAASQ